MTEIQRAKHEVSMRFWRETIMNCQASGLTIAAFCRQHGLNAHAYYYWQRQIRNKLLKQQAEPAGLTQNSASPCHQDQSSTAELPAAKMVDIVPFPEALGMAKAEPALLPPAAAPLITIRYGKLELDIRDGTPLELLHMVMSSIREEGASC